MTPVAPRPRRSASLPRSQSDAVQHALADLALGRPVVVVDDAGAETQGNLVLAAATATAEQLAFMVRHTAGFVCTALTAEDADRLGLPPMVPVDQDVRRIAYTVTVDARNNVSTGISAVDRAYTIRLLADPATTAGDLSRPGHVVPLRATYGGVLARRGHAEAAVDLARLAGLQPAAALCALVNDDGSLARMSDLSAFCAEQELAMLTIDDIVQYRRRHERQVIAVADARLPTAHGTFRAVGYADLLRENEHMALVFGDIGDGEDVLVRIHAECVTGDVFGSMRCDCGSQLDASLAAVAAEGRGVVLYLRAEEGPGVGLLEKLRAYELQDAADTPDADADVSLPEEARDYGTAAQILADVGVRSMRLLTNDPGAYVALEAHAFTEVGRVPMQVLPNAENSSCLRAKPDCTAYGLAAVDLYTAVAHVVGATDGETDVERQRDLLPVAR